MQHRLFYCDHYAIHLPAGHKFPMAKYRMLRDLLASDGCFHFEAAPFADPTTIELAHDSAYVRDFLNGALPEAVIRRIGFPWSEALVKRTLASVGGTLGATCDAFDSGWGGNLAGGTHHAFRAEGSGFCVFNDIAVAIQWLRAKGRMQRAAVIDLDVHQGDGTAQIFETDTNVLTLSMHAKSNFPFASSKARSTSSSRTARAIRNISAHSTPCFRVSSPSSPTSSSINPVWTRWRPTRSGGWRSRTLASRNATGA